MTWSLVNHGRRKVSDRELFRATALGPRTISVGNLQAGGTGKTPVVQKIAREAIERGLQVCILSRGYGGSASKKGMVLAPRDLVAHPTVVGDEVVLLQQVVPEAWIGVGANRREVFARIQKRARGRIDLVLLDDGFQNFKIKKDLEVVLLTGFKTSQKYYRDFYAAVRPWHLQVWTKGETPPVGYGTDGVRVQMELRQCLGKELSKGSKIQVITAIGSPEVFEKQLRDRGFEVQAKQFFRDHYPYTLEQVQGWLQSAVQTKQTLAVTAKDWVKWQVLLKEAGVRVGVFDAAGALLEWKLPVAVFDEEPKIVAGEETWTRKLWGLG